MCCSDVEILLFPPHSIPRINIAVPGLFLTEIGDLSYVSDGPRKITTYGLLAVYQGGQTSKADLSRQMAGQSS